MLQIKTTVSNFTPNNTLFNYSCPLYQTRYDYFYVPTDFDTKKKSLRGKSRRKRLEIGASKVIH